MAGMASPGQTTATDAAVDADGMTIVCRFYLSTLPAFLKW
jgi:hypothetical protein